MLLDSSWEAFLKQSNGQEIVAADSVLLKQIKMIFSKMNSLSLSPSFPLPLSPFLPPGPMACTYCLNTLLTFVFVFVFFLIQCGLCQRNAEIKHVWEKTNLKQTVKCL